MFIINCVVCEYARKAYVKNTPSLSVVLNLFYGELFLMKGNKIESTPLISLAELINGVLFTN